MTLTREERVMILDGLILKMDEYKKILRTSQSDRQIRFALDMLSACNSSYDKILKMEVK